MTTKRRRGPAGLGAVVPAGRMAAGPVRAMDLRGIAKETLGNLGGGASSRGLGDDDIGAG